MGNNSQLKLSKLVEELSHELRTPLSAILGYSEILTKSNNLDEIERNHLEKITSSGRRLLDVINDIVEISHIESGKIRADANLIATNTFVEDLYRKFDKVAKLKGLDYTINVDPTMDEAFKGDEKKLKSIIYSLMNNAVKFTEEGKIEVTLSIVPSGEMKDGFMLKAVIIDSGIGIDKSDIPHVFKPFWQADVDKNLGTGLGLTTCKKLLHILNGSIHMESKSGEGTEVEILVPIKKQNSIMHQTSSNQAKFNKSKNKKSLRALIVDDMPVNRTLARIMLEMKNFETIEAVNGKEAINCFMEEKPDLILMDISMPIMDGIEAMEKIRQLNGVGKEVPIIAITAGGHTGSRNELIQKGFSEYIQKPFKERELFEKISLFLPLANSEIRKSPLRHTSISM